jgi:predicted DsbA family dithiol-disulfide isomerase
MNNRKYVAEIRNDQAQGRKAGARGTPAFYFGLTIPDSSTIRVTKYIRGGQPYAKFEKVIEELLQAKK